jgi:hypothetical protein
MAEDITPETPGSPAGEADPAEEPEVVAHSAGESWDGEESWDDVAWCVINSNTD